jgi:hypothetical protein
MTMRCTIMANPSRESVLDSAHWTMVVVVVRDFLVSTLETMFRAPRYMGAKQQLSRGRNVLAMVSL